MLDIQKVTPFLWFDHEAEEAARLYVSIFEDAEIGSVQAGPDGKAMVVNFRLSNQIFHALNGGPYHKFSPAISFVVRCESQGEVDHFWNSLGKEGEYLQCGWLTDKFGLAWQIVPTAFLDMLAEGSPDQCKAVMAAMMQMVKLDIETLVRFALGLPYAMMQMVKLDIETLRAAYDSVR